MVSDSRPTTIPEALEQFLLQLRADGRSEHTVLQYQRHVLALGRWLVSEGGEARLADLSPQLVARFMVSPMARMRPDGKPKKATAVNGLRSSIRGFCQFLHEAGFLSRNPAALLRRALCSPCPSRALSQEEVERFLAVLAEGTDAKARRDRVLFTLMLSTGIRIGSALGLDVEDVDLERGELLLRGAKGNRVDRVFLSGAAAQALGAHLDGMASGPVFRNGDGERMTARHTNRRLGQWFERAGIQRLRGTHCLRHTFGTALYRSTGDILLVKEALCHRSVASTLVYAKVEETRLRASCASLGL